MPKTIKWKLEFVIAELTTITLQGTSTLINIQLAHLLFLLVFLSAFLLSCWVFYMLQGVTLKSSNKANYIRAKKCLLHSKGSLIKLELVESSSKISLSLYPLRVTSILTISLLNHISMSWG